MSAVLAEWSTSCLDWETRIVNGDTLTPCPPLFPEFAASAMVTFDSLIMVDAPNKPTMGEASLPWMREFVQGIFGSYEEQTGVRHITEFFMLISKKNGKSTDAAAIMLTALILNWRESGEYIILAPTKEIADNAFKPARDMVNADPELQEFLHVQEHIRTITHLGTNATLKVVAANSETVGGKKAIGILVDELWLLGMNAKAADMLREAIGGIAARPEGFVIWLSTQSDQPPAGVFKDKLEYARKVRDGAISDPQFYPIIYEFPKYMLEGPNPAAHEPENFYVTNPNMDVSVNRLFLEREMRKASETSVKEAQGFMAKHLNIELGMALGDEAWPGAPFWMQAARPELCALDRILADSEVITIGVDGGGLDDLLGLSVVGRERRNGDEPQRWRMWNYAWAHESVMKRRMEIAPRLQDFAKLKQLTLSPKIGDDTAAVGEIVKRVFDTGLLYQIGMDPAGIGGILTAILQAGVPQDKMVSVNQGWRLAGSIKTTERKLAEGILVQQGTELMNWCVGNAKVKVVGNSIVITKQISGTAKIDPLMAGFNAVSLMALEPPSQINTYDYGDMVIG